MATLISIVGWLGQACFFTRFLVQWIASERVRRSIVPSVFWKLSILGSLLAVIYAWLGPSHDVIFAASYVFNLVIYSRNILLERRPGARLSAPTLVATALAVALGAVLALSRDPTVAAMLERELPLWLAIGICGQILWATRFLLQWFLAERSGRPILPPSFFVVSLVGSLLLLAYAIHKRDAVLIAGMVPGPIVYARNLILLRRARLASPDSGPLPAALLDAPRAGS